MDTDQFILFRDSKVHYDIYGDGKVVVLIHGFGEDGSIWNYTSNKLKNSFKIVIPDLPGSGTSEILKEDLQISVDDYAEVISEILKKESIKKCIVIGHSMGGYIALAIANNYSEMLTGIGLINSTAYADDEAKKQDRQRSIEFLQQNDATSFLKTSVPKLFADKFKEEKIIEIQALIDSLKYFTSEVLIQYQRAMINRPQRVDVLQKNNLPVLFIIGEKDPVIPLEKSLQQCHLPAISYVHILEEAGHMCMIEKKEECFELLTSYLNNI